MNKNDKNNENKTFAEIFKEKIKELDLTTSKSINQNSVELSPNSNDKGQDYATNTHNPTITTLGYGNISNTTTQRVALYTQQHRTSDTGNARKHTTLLADLLAISSTEQEFKQGNADITKGNRNESTSTAKGAESGAQSRESRAISQTSKDTEAIYRKSLECTELEKAEFNRLFLAFLKLNKEIETNLEKKYNDNIDKIIKEHNAKKQYVYATQLGHFTQETMKKIRKEVFFLKSYGYEISPQNIKAIKNLLELGQDKAMKM